LITWLRISKHGSTEYLSASPQLDKVKLISQIANEVIVIPPSLVKVLNTWIGRRPFVTALKKFQLKNNHLSSVPSVKYKKYLYFYKLFQPN
jgi:hypothetical protein